MMDLGEVCLSSMLCMNAAECMRRLVLDYRTLIMTILQRSRKMLLQIVFRFSLCHLPASN